MVVEKSESWIRGKFKSRRAAAIAAPDSTPRKAVGQDSKNLFRRSPSTVAPLGWEHVNLTGDYVWVADQSAVPTNDELRPLRTPPTPFPKVA